MKETKITIFLIGSQPYKSHKEGSILLGVYLILKFLEMRRFGHPSIPFRHGLTFVCQQGVLVSIAQSSASAFQPDHNFMINEQLVGNSNKKGL